MNVNIDKAFSEYIFKAIQGIRNSKLRPGSHTIFDYVTTVFGTNAGACFIDITIQILLKNNLIENKPPSKHLLPSNFFIKQTSSDFHNVNFKEMTNNSKTLTQATQTTASMNYSYVSNEVFDAVYVDYIKLKKYVDDIINSLTVKNKVYEKSGSNNNQSKLKFLEVEILKLQT